MPHKTAIDPNGYLFALPALGLPPHDGDWVRVLIGIGSKQDCTRLAHDVDPEDAPLRIHNSLYGIIEVELDGAVWFLPVSVGELRTNPSSTAAEICSVKVQRMRTSTSPPANRPKVPEGSDWAYLNMRAGQMGFGQFPRDDSSLLARIDSPYAKEGLDLFRMCSDPTPSQCQPSGPTLQNRSTSVTTEEERKKQGICAVAWDIWNAAGEHTVNQEWLSQLQPQGHSGEDMAFSIRVSPESDNDVRGVDYSLRDDAEQPPRHVVDWHPLPDDAVDLRWALAGVNIQRYAFGKRLFTRDTWSSRRPTTLMLRPRQG